MEKEMTTHQKWVREIDAAEESLKKFRERGRTVVKRYLDERDTATADFRWFNIFYANTNILQAALYAQTPKPIVDRKFKDFNDDVARVAAIILQRNITQDIDDPDDNFDSTVRNAIHDRLVPGAGVAWLRLETETEAIELPESQPGIEAESEEDQLERISYQKVCVDYVYWQDFLFSPCRVWEERRWTGRVVYMDRDALIKRFGEDLGKQVPLDCNVSEGRPTDSGVGGGSDMQSVDTVTKKARIYEIWVRDGRKVIWLSKGFSTVLDEKDDPLQLTNFEPCPTPMLANITTSTTVPRPDYYMIQDQYKELDDLNNRISRLIKACKVVGLYDKSSKGVARLLAEGFDNDMIPVDNWAQFAEKGGMKGQVDWLPLETVTAALVQLINNREIVKQQIYELTGIADIVRGASKASETLGAQEIKAKFASVRIKRLQDEVARFVGDILRIKAEIMVRHFDPEILIKNSNILSTDDADLVPQAIQLLTDPEQFEWRITVTADSIAQADYDMEKQDRIEFLTAVSSYLEKAGMMFQTVPQSAPLLIGMLKWAVAGFKNAHEIEGMMDKALDAVNKQPPEDKPDPEQQKLQMEQQKAQADMQMRQQEKQADMQMEQQRFQMQLQIEQQKLQMLREQNEMKLQFEREMSELKLYFEKQMAQVKLGIAVQDAQLKQQVGEQQAQQQMQLKDQEHAQNLEIKTEQAEVDIANKRAMAEATPKPEKKDAS